MTSSIRLSWKSVKLSADNMGHGLCIYKDSEHRRERLAAFVDGFAWLHGGEKAVVLFDPEMMPADQQQFAAFKTALESRIRSRNIAPSELVSGYHCIANA
jgi:hypothetical protein